MKLSDVLIRMLWVGTDHPFWCLHPATAGLTRRVATIHLDQLLQEMYALRDPDGALEEALDVLDDEVPGTWYDHLPLFEEFYAPRS